MNRHIIVCGLGHVGYRIVDLLLSLGEPVTVVTLQTREEWVEDVEERGATVLRGDARDQRLLEKAGLLQARALIAATDVDLVNIEVALDARRLRPDLPVVARLFDQSLAGPIESSLGIRRALSVAALAAPAFAAAALGEQIVGSFTLEGSLLVIGHLTVAGGAPLDGLTLGELQERYHLLAISHERSGSPAAFPPEPEPVLRLGDRLTVLCRKEDWDSVAGVDAGPSRSARAGRQWHRLARRALSPARWARAARRFWQNTLLPLRVAFVLLNVVTLVSVFVFSAGMHLRLLDALYFVITTVTTVGYGDITPKEAPALLKLYGCLLMLLGPATIATLYSIITDFMVTARFQLLLGQRGIPAEGHVVIVGLGRVGYRIMEELQRLGASVVAIDTDPNHFAVAARAHVPVIIGDARVPEILGRSAAANARAVLAVTGDDAANLAVMLAVRQTPWPVRTVVRLFDADFAQKVRVTLGVDAAMSTSRIAAPTFVAAALDSGVSKAFLADGFLYTIRQAAPGSDAAAPDLPDSRAKAVMTVRCRDGRLYPADAERGDDGREETLTIIRRKLLTPLQE
jgi:Trk K+ transport system NAD-binding subunit